MVAGLFWSLISALAYGAAAVLQASGVRRAGAAGGGPGDLVAVGRQPLYLLGLGVDGGGFVGTLLALQTLPLFLVQAVGAGSVAVTAGLAALMGARLRRSGWVALTAASVGLILLSLSAVAQSAVELPIGWRWLLLALTVPMAVLAAIAPRLGARIATSVLALGAGICFTVVAIASRTLQFPHPLWQILLDPSLWAVISSGVAGTVLFAIALHAGSVTAVSGITVTTQTVIPAAVGVGLLGDAVRDGYWVLAVLGFVLAVIGALALAGFAAQATEDISRAPVGEVHPGAPVGEVRPRQ